jgi:peptide/nickel transport system permease protein
MSAILALPRARHWRQAPLLRAAIRFSRMKMPMCGLVLLLLVLGAIILLPLLLGTTPDTIDLLALHAPPSAEHWLGTDGVGRDVFARVLAGGRVSMMVACGSVSIALTIGFAVGAVAALGGPIANAVAMRSVDLAMTLPPVVLLLVLSAIAGQGVGSTILVIAVLSWPVLARLVRARLMELRERDFVIAARGMGARFWHIILRHGLPNSIDILVVYTTLQIASAILLEAGLSFLGLGIPPPAASWGNMLNTARSTVVLEQYPWEWLAPGAALLLTTLAINFVGDGLRGALDPRSDLG